MNEWELQEELLHSLNVEARRVVGVVGVEGGGDLLPLDEVLVIVEVAGVGWDAEVVAHVDRLRHVFASDQRLVELLAVACADDLDLGLHGLLAQLGALLRELENRLRERLDGGRGRLLDEQVAVLAVFPGEEDEIHGILEGHHEPRHAGVRDGEGLAGLDLVDEERDDAATAGHDVAIAGAADGGLRLLAEGASLGDGDLLHEGLGHTHRVDRVGGLVRGEDDDILHPVRNRALNDIVRADDIGIDGLEREELATRHLLQGRRREDVVHALHDAINRLPVTHIADVELDVRRLQLVPHIVLLLLITGENTDLLELVDEPIQNSMPEAPCSTGNQQRLICILFFHF